MKHFIYLLIFLTACNSNSSQESALKNEEENIKIDSSRIEVIKKTKEVMAVHDFAMEKMGEMAQLKKKLAEKKSTLDTSKIELIDQAIKDLEDADKIMWDWMHQYKTDRVDTSTVEIALDYLAEQKMKVDIVDLKIKESLKNGYELLEE